jgi:hypothetical protein
VLFCLLFVSFRLQDNEMLSRLTLRFVPMFGKNIPSMDKMSFCVFFEFGWFPLLKGLGPKPSGVLLAHGERNNELIRYLAADGELSSQRSRWPSACTARTMVSPCMLSPSGGK